MHKKCVVCQYLFYQGNKQQSNFVIQESIIQCFIKSGIIIKQDCRSSLNHFIDNTNKFTDEAIEMIQPVTKEVNLDNNEVEQLLMRLRDRVNKNSIFERFKDPYLPSNETFIRTCGVSKGQSIELLGYLSTMNNTVFPTKSQALAVYLFWLKTSCTQDIIATYIGANLSQRDISHYCDQVRVSLNQR